MRGSSRPRRASAREAASRGRGGGGAARAAAATIERHPRWGSLTEDIDGLRVGLPVASSTSSGTFVRLLSDRATRCAARVFGGKSPLSRSRVRERMRAFTEGADVRETLRS